MLSSGNYWRATNRTLTWYECRQTQACLRDTETGYCATGYLNGSILCAVCDEGYAFTAVGGKCSICKSTGDNIVTIVFLLIALYIIFFFLIFVNYHSDYEDLFPLYTKLLFNHMQYLAIISKFGLTYPATLEALFDFQRYATPYHTTPHHTTPHHTTPHHTTPHHTTPHHTTSHHTTPHRSPTAHCPQAVRQCVAGVALPTAAEP